jgi:hypothetical protein
MATALLGYVPSVLRGDRSKKQEPLKWVMACRTAAAAAAAHAGDVDSELDVSLR